ncbi:hypothetical protein ES703_40945 [subsurface metagenome]
MNCYWDKHDLRVIIYSILIISLLALLSCDIFDSRGNIIPIEGDIIFSIKEDYEHYDSICEPSVLLSMETEKIYGCCNFTIESEIGIYDSKILIDISGIYVPEICLTALGPATSKSFLDVSDGEYLLELSYRGVTDEYILIITNSYIKVTEVESHFTEFDINLFWRYPFNSFAYLCGTTTENSWICEDFLDTLLSMMELEEFHFPDSGEICYPCSSSGHYYDMPGKYFFYENEEDFDYAGEILEIYSRNVISQYSGIGLSLINWKNKKYYSWLFNK